ncbi:hypothetical protein MKW94_006732 [Papaver nudicaule]|uniref:Core Histone H2A/H2B/H3 domain-containing protein n=1 Tax=Papaver nudicaule TaxID=74823 RepID=A0AA41SAM1_PAPNU|nr:hypothetical protein [Papaver nudicaule]
MAPKRSSGKVVVKTTKKVTEETVDISVVDETGEVGNEEHTVTKNINVVEETIQKKPQQETAAKVTPLKIEGPKDQTKGKQDGKEEGKKTQDGKETEKPEVVVNGKAKGQQKVQKTQATGKGEKEKKQRTGRKRKMFTGVEGEYKRYVYKVLKQVHPDLGVSSRAMVIINGLMNDMFERLAKEASKLCDYTGRMTLSSREVQSAVRLVLPGELAKHAISEGVKAVTNYTTQGSA